MDDRDFCENCDNKLKIGCDFKEGEKYPVLISICETCNQINSYTLDEIEDKKINYTPYMIDYSRKQFGNIIDDNTIPYAINQKCEKCENTKIKQICTNLNNMKYIFICVECKSQWSTS
jgi:hypothetical protein